MDVKPIRILIHGASGRMGRALLRLAAEDTRFAVVAAVSRSGATLDGVSVPTYAAGNLSTCPAFDVAIDFSLPDGFDLVLAECLRRGAALVSGTTALSEHHRSRLTNAGKTIAVLWASNFSLGVVVLEDLVRRAAVALRQWQVEIVEMHHVHKLDAPSGTALMLAQAAQTWHGAPPVIRSVRDGDIIGNHVVRFSGPGETLELTHDANDRDVFARGALEAAARMAHRPPGNHHLAKLLFRD